MIGCAAFATMLHETRMQRLRREIGRTFVLALPLVVGQLLTIAMNVTDTVLAGHLGTDVLAAVSMGYNAWILALLIVIGVLMAVPPAVSQLDGAGRRAEIGFVFRQAVWLALALGVVLFVALRCSEPLLRKAGVSEAIVPRSMEFLGAISWGAPALALFFTCRNTSDGLSLTRPTMYVSALGAVLLLPVARVLMYGELGVPALGAAGAGYAHASVLWVMALAYLAILARGSGYRAARLFERFDPPSWPAIGRLLRVGVPMGITIFMEGSLFVATAWIVGSFGEIAASAHAVALNVASFTFMVPLGIAMATTVRVGNAVGRGDGPGVGWAGAAGFALALAAQCVAALTLLFFPRAIAGLYSTDAAVIALATTLLGYAAIFQLSDGAQALFNGALRGLEDTIVPAWITAFAYWGVGFTLGWYLGRHRGEGPTGMWQGLVAGLTAAAVLLMARFVWNARRYARHPHLVHPRGAAAGELAPAGERSNAATPT
jgi:MATE family multidrug resistance protein